MEVLDKTERMIWKIIPEKKQMKKIRKTARCRHKKV
jgi:hypothetical protein